MKIVPTAYTYDGFDDDKVVHGFFTRKGGVSTGIYAGLNCGVGSEDDADHVQENRDAVCSCLGVNSLVGLYQEHGSQCHHVIKGWSDADRPKGDAFVTDQVGIALGILTADCAPVLFYGQKPDGAPVIGAAHAGWKGAIGGVLDAVVQAMAQYDATPDTITAAVGPCIAKKSYEVDEGFIRTFVERDEAYEAFFGAGARDGHYQFDLEGFCAARLAQIGVRNVYTFGVDTYANEDEFYSYRRTTHRGEADYGRQVSAIAIRRV